MRRLRAIYTPPRAVWLGHVEVGPQGIIIVQPLFQLGGTRRKRGARDRSIRMVPPHRRYGTSFILTAASGWRPLTGSFSRLEPSISLFYANYLRGASILLSSAQCPTREGDGNGIPPLLCLGVD